MRGSHDDQDVEDAIIREEGRKADRLMTEHRAEWEAENRRIREAERTGEEVTEAASTDKLYAEIKGLSPLAAEIRAYLYRPRRPGSDLTDREQLLRAISGLEQDAAWKKKARAVIEDLKTSLSHARDGFCIMHRRQALAVPALMEANIEAYNATLTRALRFGASAPEDSAS